MPSIFPGIDPYIESQYYWPDFHGQFIVYCIGALGDLLPDQYEARLDERIRLIAPAESDAEPTFKPDVAIVRSSPSSGNGGVAVMDPPRVTVEPVKIAALIFDEVRELSIRILHREDRRLVTVIELLSPENKVARADNSYLSKRNEMFGRPVHTVELDFLIGGHRLPMRTPLPPGDAYAIVSRREARPVCDVYAWPIRSPLPTIAIPLAQPDPDLMLDLAAVYALTFERGRYARSLDRKSAMTLPLSDQDRQWVEGLAKG